MSGMIDARMARILIVEDDPSLAHIVADVLHEGGHEVLCSEAGRTALADALAFSPDVVLLDLVMPQPDGRAVLAQLRADPDLHAVPVVLMTGVREPEQIAGQVGACCVLKKPFDLDDVPSCVQEALWRTSQRGN